MFLVDFALPYSEEFFNVGLNPFLDLHHFFLLQLSNLSHNSRRVFKSDGKLRTCRSVISSLAASDNAK